MPDAPRTDPLRRLDRAIDRAATNGKVDAKVMHDFIADLRAEAATPDGSSFRGNATPADSLDAPEMAALEALFAQAIENGIESETDYYGGGQDREAYIDRPARDYAEKALTLRRSPRNDDHVFLNGTCCCGAKEPQP